MGLGLAWNRSAICIRNLSTKSRISWADVKSRPVWVHSVTVNYLFWISIFIDYCAIYACLSPTREWLNCSSVYFECILHAQSWDVWIARIKNTRARVEMSQALEHGRVLGIMELYIKPFNRFHLCEMQANCFDCCLFQKIYCGLLHGQTVLGTNCCWPSLFAISSPPCTCKIKFLLLSTPSVPLGVCPNWLVALAFAVFVPGPASSRALQVQVDHF